MLLIDPSIVLAYWIHQYSIPMIGSSVDLLEPLWGVKGMDFVIKSFEKQRLITDIIQEQ
jgi:hypothetical protein